MFSLLFHMMILLYFEADKGQVTTKDVTMDTHLRIEKEQDNFRHTLFCNQVSGLKLHIIKDLQPLHVETPVSI